MVMSSHNNQSRDRSAAFLPEAVTARASKNQNPRADHVKVNPMNRSDRKPIQKRASRWVTALLLSASTITTTPAVAQGVVTSTGAAERINLSEQIRTQAQQISLAACYLKAGIGSPDFKTKTLEALSQVDAILPALRDGDADFAIPVPEKDRKALAAIENVTTVWNDFATQAKALGTTGDVTAAEAIIQQNSEIMAVSEYLKQELMNVHSVPPELVYAYAITISVVGRQRTLALELATDVCGLATTTAPEGATDDLDDTIKLMDASLYAMRDGRKNSGVIEAPTIEINFKMSNLFYRWTLLKYELERAKSGVRLEESLAIHDRLSILSANFDEVMQLYILASKPAI